MDKQVLDELERLVAASKNIALSGSERAYAANTLSALLRTHAPALLAAARDAERLRAVVKEHANVGHDWTKCLCVYCEAHRAALSRDGGG